MCTRTHTHTHTLTQTHSVANIPWESNLTPIDVPQFSRPTGPKLPIPASIVGIFQLFFTTSLMEYIVQQTNLYARQCMGDDQYAAWTVITTEELSAFFGFMICMGLVHVSALTEYWSKDETFRYSPVADRISRDRYMEIQRYLHFADNTTLEPPGSPAYNKLGKVQTVLDTLNIRFQEAYNLHRDISVDEPFKGRSTLKQYLPNKPVKRGIKVWMLADAKTGYLTNFEVYTDKKGSTSPQKF